MIVFVLLVLALVCINIAIYSVQHKRVDDKLKELEKEIFKEFSIKSKK